VLNDSSPAHIRRMQPEDRRSLISWSLAAVAAIVTAFALVTHGLSRQGLVACLNEIARNAFANMPKNKPAISNDNAADRAPLDIVHPSSANTTIRWSEQDAAAKTKTNNGGSGAGR